ncbi:MAG: integrase arm-type DNA-binding domain-containing protein [Variovorax sp.]
MLTDLKCKRAECPADKARARFADEGGLYLEVAPNGRKRWFWKFYSEGKEKRLALGSYPETALKDARAARDEARQLKRTGVDPAKQRQIQKLTGRSTTDNSFEGVAREFHKVKKSSWSPRYGERWLSLMERDAFPWIGRLPMRDITAPMLLQVLRRAEARGAHEVAHTLRQWSGQAFRHGIAIGKCTHNPAPDLHGALVPVNVKHMAAVLEPVKAGELMRSIANYAGQPATRTGLLPVSWTPA